MSRTIVVALALLSALALSGATAPACLAAPTPGSVRHYPQRPHTTPLTRSSPAPGSIVVTFAGSGSGGYGYRIPGTRADAANSGCPGPAQSYSERDSYDWYFTFSVPAGGAVLLAPSALRGGGTVSGVASQCAGSTPSSTTCRLRLTVPGSADSGDLEYPNLSVTETGSRVTVGVIGELVFSTNAPGCADSAVYQANPVAGFGELQANVTVARAALMHTGHATAAFTMAGSGLFAGVSLSGACNGLTCDPLSCQSGAAGTLGAACSYDEGYAGTVELRVVK